LNNQSFNNLNIDPSPANTAAIINPAINPVVPRNNNNNRLHLSGTQKCLIIAVLLLIVCSGIVLGVTLNKNKAEDNPSPEPDPAPKPNPEEVCGQGIETKLNEFNNQVNSIQGQTPPLELNFNDGDVVIRLMMEALQLEKQIALFMKF